MKSSKPKQPLTVVYQDVGLLQTDPRNARRHPKAQIEQLRASIRQYGFTQPVLLRDDGKTLGAGHGRLEAAKAEGLAQVPTITIHGLTDKQWRAYAIADNKLPMGAEWDLDMLKAELNDLQGFGFDLTEMGFGDLELGQIGVDGFELSQRLEKAEETPEPPAKPVVALGELWLLGDHRLFIGDSTKAEDVTRAVGEASPHLMVTDPPYGVEYDPKWRGKYDQFERHSIGMVQNDDRADWSEAWKNFTGRVAYVWSADLRSKDVIDSLLNSGFVLRAQIIWVKQHFQFSRGDYHWQHEPCWYAVRKGKGGHWTGDRKQTTVWEIANKNPMGGKQDDANTTHGTQKPIECMRRPILNNSKPGDAVYDPFLGSGTTLIACEMEKRRCFGLEIDPAYGQVIIERWEKFTGKTATRQDGKTLADLKNPKTGKATQKANKPLATV